MDNSLTTAIDLVRAAAANKTPVRIRGGGSKDFYWPAGGAPQAGVQAPAQAGQVLDTTPLGGIISYEPSELVVTVRAGTPLAELEALLAEKGQCLPFEPPHYGDAQATVGGMVAAGLAGPARAAVGGARDYVLGLELLNGRAELLRFGGTVMKNVAGYDVSRLMVGAMGTLGLITEVSLKVLPVASAEATLKFVMDEADAIRQLNTWAGQPLPLNASSWVIDAGVPTLYLRLRGAVAAVEAACGMFTAQHGGVRVDSPETRADWSAARDLKLPWFADGFKRGDDLWRVSVPPTAAPLNLGDTMMDWLGGQRWLWLAPDDVETAKRVVNRARTSGGVATMFIPANAHISSPEGSKGLNFSNQTGKSESGPISAISQRLKHEFDPNGIFNPGRLISA